MPATIPPPFQAVTRAPRGLGVGFLGCAALLAGCFGGGESPATLRVELQATWGRQGVSEGRFQKPRAMAIDAQGRLYIVDMTARVQVFDADGTYLRSWETPEHAHGRPTGISVARGGQILVADTHYYRVLVYSPEGELLRTLGGTPGHGPGEFGLVTDVVEDEAGNWYVAEYGEFDRIQKFDPQGRFLLEWGGHGDEPGQFARPQSLALDESGAVWVADSCNHRIQVFDGEGKFLRAWGRQGSGAGELSYPYSLLLDGQGHLYVCEYGNHRVQKFTLAGESLGVWGTHGRGEGELYNPWAIVWNGRERMYVLDSLNHRVHALRLH